jgi:hypothetical protein
VQLLLVLALGKGLLVVGNVLREAHKHGDLRLWQAVRDYTVTLTVVRKLAHCSVPPPPEAIGNIPVAVGSSGSISAPTSPTHGSDHIQ